MKLTSEEEEENTEAEYKSEVTEVSNHLRDDSAERERFALEHNRIQSKKSELMYAWVSELQEPRSKDSRGSYHYLHYIHILPLHHFGATTTQSLPNLLP